MIRGRVRYDGTGFAGWQVQPEQRTVQGALEEALSAIAGRPVRIEGAGRTDAGVHALGQVFSCRWPVDVPCGRLAHSLSKMLGPDIRVESVEVAGDGFRAGYSAIGKRYAYVFSSAVRPDPFSARYSWHVPWDLARDRVGELAQTLVGEHDFAGLAASGAEVNTTVRTIHSIELRMGGVVGPARTDELWRLEFHGTGFLYKMIRNIVGTLIDIARGKTPESRLAESLVSAGPYQGYTAPGRGLFMVEVLYDPDEG